MKYLFIDSNIWLSLYRYSENDIKKLHKLESHLNKEFLLLVPKQVIYEVTRNRENVILKTLEVLDFKIPNFPNFIKNYNESKSIIENLKASYKQLEQLKDKIYRDVRNFTLDTDKCINKLIKKAKILESDIFLPKAIERMKIGNPPGKNDCLGDAIIWETLLSNVDNNIDLYFVSMDKDFKSFFENKTNPFLTHEWENNKNSEIHYYNSLVSFLKDQIDSIVLDDQIKETDYIKQLKETDNPLVAKQICSKLSDMGVIPTIQNDLLFPHLNETSVDLSKIINNHSPTNLYYEESGILHNPFLDDLHNKNK